MKTEPEGSVFNAEIFDTEKCCTAVTPPERGGPSDANDMIP